MPTADSGHPVLPTAERILSLRRCLYWLQQYQNLLEACSVDNAFPGSSTLYTRLQRLKQRLYTVNHKNVTFYF